MPTVTPFLWFESRLDEALDFYTSVFPDTEVMWKAPGPEGATSMASFRLQGQSFNALAGGPGHPFTDAISMFVSVKDQAEVDHYWALLTDGGEEGPCGWCRDRFGLWWQVVPEALPTYLAGPDPAGAQRANTAMQQMKKLDISAIKAAYEGAAS